MAQTHPPAPRRILQVLEATEGGTRTHLRDLVLGLDPARFAVDVAVSLSRGPGFTADLERFREAGVGVHLVPMVRRPDPAADLRAARALLRLVRVGGYDLVHGHSSKGGFLGRLAARLAGVPAVYTPNAFYFQAPGLSPLERRAAVALERQAARWCETIVCVSPGERAAALAAGLPERKLRVIPNGIDLARLDAQAAAPVGDLLDDLPGALTVLTVGRRVPQKGDADLLAAWQRVLNAGVDARLVLVGGGPLQGGLEALAGELGIAERVRFLPTQPGVGALLAAADVYVLPSLYEGCPYSLLEAMASGCCCVATATEGSRDVIRDGVTGRLVPIGDPPALAEALIGVLTHPGLRRRLGQAARRYARRRHRVEDMVAETARVYEQVLATARRHARGTARG